MEPEVQANKSIDFDRYLTDYQPDLKRIIGKHRYPHHHLDEVELLSDINLSLIKKKEDILAQLGEGFCRTEFNKISYNYARNCIKWTHGRLSRISYYSKRSNGVAQTEDGPKTSFEMAVETEGYEEEGFESFDGSEKYKYIIKLIKDYSYILTPSEHKVFCLLEKDLKQEEMAEELGITRQAISICIIEMFAKIRSYLGEGVLEDDGYSGVIKGRQSIKDFFTENRAFVMEDEEMNELKDLLTSNHKVYTIHGLAEEFKGGKYGYKRLLAIINKCGLYSHIRRITKPPLHTFSKSLDKKILNLYKEGRSCYEISELLNIPVESIQAKRGWFTQTGKLPKSLNKPQGRKYHLSEEERQHSLKLFLQGKTCEEVAKETGIPVTSVRPMRGGFVRRKQLPITSEALRKKKKRNETMEAS